MGGKGLCTHSGTLPANGGITDKKLSLKPSTRREVAFCFNVAKWWYRGPKSFALPKCLICCEPRHLANLKAY